MAHPPIKLKQSASSSAAQTLTSSSSAQDARLLVRETLRISANLADSAAQPLSSSSPLSAALVDSSEFVNSSLRLICSEEIDGRRWSYVAEKDASGRFKKGSSIRALSSHNPHTPPIEVQFYKFSFFNMFICIFFAQFGIRIFLYFSIFCCLWHLELTSAYKLYIINLKPTNFHCWEQPDQLFEFINTHWLLNLQLWLNIISHAFYWCKVNEATLGITLHLLSASKQKICSVMLNNGVELEVEDLVIILLNCWCRRWCHLWDLMYFRKVSPIALLLHTSRIWHGELWR